MPAGDLSSIDELMLVEHVRIGHSQALGFKVKRGTLLLVGRASFYKWLLGVPPDTKSAVFFNIVQKAFDPPLRFEHYVANFFDGFFKKRENICRDKFRQNKA